MAAGHIHRLHSPGDTTIHRLPPQCKLASMIAFTLVVVATDPTRFPAFGLYALLLATVAVAARIPPAFLARRMVVEVPFVIFALALPFLAQGDRLIVLGLEMSADGLLAAWNILAKATLGVIASILLAATTEPRALLLGAQRMRLPAPLTQIAAFMLRYLDVIVDEMRRMRIARESRGFVARDLRHLPVVARSAGALFIRSYERGERVHLAMLSRGYTGTMPIIHDVRGTAAQWALAAMLPTAAAAVLLGGLL
ncbi:cobalt ECF transporter T component CbiQ [Acrocarpospora catenulata]|uniref:cobalt ECF transporter T component CbiQ n=1 Tax=Acrocarpospora catenulata TaxID=2836182 RepID=UPI001BD92E2B|nr:cobalt ECF transporter T component CbiQ [Acrocarpospora catenulata]